MGFEGISAWIRRAPDESTVRVIWLNGTLMSPTEAATATYDLSATVNSNEWSESPYMYGVNPDTPAAAHVLLPGGMT